MNKIYRNIRKFKLKYGFDPHLYADGWALGLNYEEFAQLLGVSQDAIKNFVVSKQSRKGQNRNS